MKLPPEETLVRKDSEVDEPPALNAKERRRDWYKKQREEHGELAMPRRTTRLTYDPFGDKPRASSDAERRRRDKFYTTEVAAALCHRAFARYLPSKAVLVDPSAGGGVFLTTCPESREIFGIEKWPDRHARPDLIDRDFLQVSDVRRYLPAELRSRSLGFITSPPFGFKFCDAIRFINHSLSQPTASAIGFILGRSARSWTVQRQVNPDARLVLDMDLPDNAVHVSGKVHTVRTCFQVWTLVPRKWPDLRIVDAPSSTHPHFRLAPYYLGRKSPADGWAFAVSNRGYRARIVSAGEYLDETFRWMVFWPSTAAVAERLLRIDYDALSLARTTGVPSFGMADVVRAYEALLVGEQGRDA